MKLRDAVEALDARKTSLYGDDDRCITQGEAARIAVGLDLDMRELTEIAEQAALVWVAGCLNGITDAMAAFRGAWSDGVMTGLLLAEMRAREAAR